MGSRLFIATALLVFAIGLLSACAQNPSTDGVDASAARAEAQGNTKQPSEELTMMEMTGSMLTSGGFPKYQVEKDGTLIIEGDMLVRCADVLQFRRNYFEGLNPTPEARRQVRHDRKELIMVCTKAGFPPDENPQSP